MFNEPLYDREKYHPILMQNGGCRIGKCDHFSLDPVSSNESIAIANDRDLRHRTRALTLAEAKVRRAPKTGSKNGPHNMVLCKFRTRSLNGSPPEMLDKDGPHSLI